MPVSTYEYKCKRCGAIENGFAGGEEIVRAVLIVLICGGKEAAMKSMAGKIGSAPSLQMLHTCKDGAGVADLIGYRTEENANG